MPAPQAPVRAPRAGLGPAAWALAVLVVLALVLVERGTWLAALLLPMAGWLAWVCWDLATHTPPPAAPAAPRRDPAADALIQRLLPLWSAQLATAQAGLNDGIDAALQSLQSILAAQDALASQLPPDGPARDALAALAAQTEAALAAMQVGDRVHQMLDVIKHDQQRLAALLAQPGGLPPQDTERWLAELQARYTTQEQRDTHAGRPPAADSAAGVQYF